MSSTRPWSASARSGSSSRRGGDRPDLPAPVPAHRRHQLCRSEGEAQPVRAGQIRTDLYHYEFIFDPFTRTQMAMEASAPKVPYEPGVPTPKPRWIIRDKNGFAPGVNILRFLGLLRALLPPGSSRASSSSGTAKMPCSTTSAAVPGRSTPRRSTTSRGTSRAPSRSRSRTRRRRSTSPRRCRQDMRPALDQPGAALPASTGTLAFTQLEPITAVFEVGMIHDERFPEYERRLDEEFRKAGIRYTMHWSKNSGINPRQARVHVRRRRRSRAGRPRGGRSSAMTRR